MSAACGAAALAAAITLAACGSTSTPPASGAARVVPADALAYVDLSLDARRSAVTQATGTLRLLPAGMKLLRAVRTRLSAVTGARFATAIAPWLGSEAAVALLPAGDSASELIVLGVRNRTLARHFVSTETNRDQHTGAAVVRLLDGYVVIGEAPAVRAAARAAQAPSRSLADAGSYRSAESGAPASRVLDGWASRSGLAELLGGRAGLAGLFAAAGADAQQVSAQLSPTGDGFVLRLRLEGLPDTAHGFTPTLVDRLPANTTWVADMASLTRSAPGLLSALGAGSSASPTSGLAGRLGQALKAEGVKLPPLEALFGGESAVFGLDGAVGLITYASDAHTARLELGAAGSALAQLFGPTNGTDTEPVVATSTINGVAVTRWRQGGAQIDDAVDDGLLVLTNSQAALGAIIDRKHPLSGSSLYRSVLAGAGTSSGPVLFGAINRLVRRGDLTGLMESFGLQSVASSLARISAVGLASTGGTSETTAELYFTIS